MVSGKPGVAQRQLVLLTGRAHPELAQAVAQELGVAITPQAAYDFANGEIFVRFEESVRGADAFVLQSHGAPVNDWLVEQLLVVVGRPARRLPDRVHPQDARSVARQPGRRRRRGPHLRRGGRHDRHGVTSTTAARQLLEQGAKDVVLVATHGVLSGDAYDRLMAGKAREVILTDTLPIPHEKRFPGLTVLGIAPLLARAIQEVFEAGSVTSLFDGNA